MFALGAEEDVTVTRLPGLTPQQASEMTQDVLKKIAIGSILVFGAIYYFLIRR